jgi:hypothetical protein
MARFDNIVTLFGQPRSGTTIISRLVCNHSKVKKIIEPYQVRRESQYAQTDLHKLCADFEIEEVVDTSLFVKETTTRRKNIRHLSGLMENAAHKGYRVSYIFVLRSPLEAFLSQIEASEKFWKKKTAFGRDEASLKGFWTEFLGSMDVYLNFAFRFHRRIVFYDRIVSDPQGELGRIMGLFAYPVEAGQTDLSEADPKFGGDPKARGTSASIGPRADNRQDEVAKLEEEFGANPHFRHMLQLHRFIKDPSNHRKTADRLIRDLALLAKTRENRPAMSE